MSVPQPAQMQARFLPRITGVERFTLDVPFRPRVQPWNRLLVEQWRIVEVLRLTTDSPGIEGWGETVLHYTWGRVSDDAVQRVVGRSLAECVGDDSLGAGLQMAVYDALGRALELPVYRLLGLPQVRKYALLAWWSTKMPPDVLAREAQDAVAEGYLAHKFKARPWFDIWAQVEAVSAVTPPHYAIEPDFNDMLLDSANAARVLSALDGYERISLYEGPIPQRDVAGYQQLRARGGVKHPIAMHYGLPDFPTVVRNQMCDGFVLNQGIAATLLQGQMAGTFEMPFFLQLVGGGLTTALLAHLASVLPGCRWPGVTCLNMYADDLLQERLTMRAGGIAVPDAPGLGVTLNPDVLEKYRMTPPYALAPPRHILTVAYAGGKKVHYPYAARPRAAGVSPYSHLQYASGAAVQSGPGLWEDALGGNMPIYPRGVTTTVWDDDGSAEWADLWTRAHRAPVWTT